MLAGASARAALTFELTTGDSAANISDMPFDSNKCPAEGPTSTYVAGRLTNTGASIVTNVTATISNLGGGFSLAGTQSSTLFIGAMSPGDERLLGWLINGTCSDGTFRDVTIAVSGDAVTGDSDIIRLVSRSAQSANAGGNVLSTTLGAGAVVGQTITADVQYDFGNIKAGNEFIMHPAGNSDFDAACLQLIGSEVIGSNITGITVGDENQLYFVSPIKQSGNGYNATIRFSYRYLCAGTTSTARPFAAQTSGGTNIKYTGNFDGGGALVFDFPTSTNPFTITKTVSETALLFDNGPHSVTYTVTITNPSTFDTTIDGFIDTLPSGVSFDALAPGGDVSAANSSSLPGNGDAGAITFAGISGSTYALSANSSISLVYTSEVADVIGDYVNSAIGYVGAETIGPATATVSVAAPVLTATKEVAIYDPNNDGLFMIPTNDVVYTISIENTGLFTADPDKLVIIDDMPGEIEFFNGDFDPVMTNMGPFNFDPGTSTLACCTTAHIDYSSTTTGIPVFGYPPDSGYDGDVTYIRISPGGALNPGESFSVQFRARIK